LKAGHLSDIVALAQRPETDNRGVKTHQLAKFLIEHGHASSVSEFVDPMMNPKERRSVGLLCLERMRIRVDSGQAIDKDDQALCFKIYLSVPDEQKAELQKRAGDLRLEIDWPDRERTA